MREAGNLPSRESLITIVCSSNSRPFETNRSRRAQFRHTRKAKIVTYFTAKRNYEDVTISAMDKKPGDILKNALLPPSQQSHEAVAKAFAESEANFVRMSFETTLQTQANQPVKQEMIDTIVASTYKLLYRKAMRLLEGKPISNQQEDHEDLQAIQELGPVLVVLRGLPHRPLSRGDIAIKALKLKREGLKFSEATDQICDCGQNDHDESCRESIRQARMRLERLLKKHKVNLP